jgi:mono/diheme cytochrome c family protein
MQNHRLRALTLGVLLAIATPVCAGDAEKGKGIYAARCAFCHGLSGRGDGPAGAALKPPPTNFATAEFWKRTNPDAIKTVIENGKPGTTMVPFKGSLSPAQVDDVVTYLGSFKPAR